MNGTQSPIRENWILIIHVNVYLAGCFPSAPPGLHSALCQGRLTRTDSVLGSLALWLLIEVSQWEALADQRASGEWDTLALTRAQT